MIDFWKGCFDCVLANMLQGTGKACTLKLRTKCLPALEMIKIYILKSGSKLTGVYRCPM